MKNNLIKERILEIFTFSTALEVTFYNEEGKFINSTLKDSTFNLLNNLNFNIKTFPLKKLNPNLNIKDYLSKSEIKYIPINNSPFEFAVIYINSCKGFNNYFLIGPYNSKKEIKLEDSLYR